MLPAGGGLLFAGELSAGGVFDGGLLSAGGVFAGGDGLSKGYFKVNKKVEAKEATPENKDEL